MSETTVYTNDTLINEMEERSALLAEHKETIGDYFEIYGQNDSGGMGGIFYCRDKRTGTYHVLKTTKLDSAKDALFKEEAKFALELEKHPHVVYTHTIIKDEDKYYIVMELVGEEPKDKNAKPKGNTLVEEFNRHPEGIPVDKAFRWAIEFCEGMEYLNRKGLKAHKDIKASNIFITPEGKVKIGDFGLAHLFGKGGVGTPGYRAPESFGEGAIYNTQSDIYSFGIVLYQLFKGGSNLVEGTRYSDKGTEGTIDVASIKSAYCEGIIKKCLDKDPDERYGSFGEIQEAVIEEYRGIDKNYQYTVAKVEPLSLNEYRYKAMGWSTVGNWYYADRIKQRILKLPGRTAEDYFAKGWACTHPFGYSNYQEGIKYCDKAIELDPKHSEWYSYRAFVKYDMNFYVLVNYSGWDEDMQCVEPVQLWADEEIIADYSRAIELDSKNASLYYDRARIKEDMEDYEGAVEDCSKAIELNPQDGWYYRTRAECREKIKDYEGALADYSKLINSEPKDDGCYILRAEFKERIKDYEGAIADYSKAIELDPKHASAHNNLIELYEKLGNKEKAEEVRKLKEKNCKN